MNETLPTAEAVLIDDDIIVAVGELDELEAYARNALKVNLEGHTLLPAFIDAHGHFIAYANSLLQLDLLDCHSLLQLKNALEGFEKPRGSWLIAKNFDTTGFDKLPDREFLDSVQGENPLIIQFRSGHAGFVNSLALNALKLTASTEIDGGRLGRDESGSLNGYLEENAFIQSMKKVPPCDESELLSACRAAQEVYLSHGISIAQEGMMTVETVPLYLTLLKSDILKLDIIGYADRDCYEALKIALSGLSKNFTLAGIKVFLDGSPQSKTAHMLPCSRYLDGTTGYAVMQSNELICALEYCAKHRIQLLAHCNGDAAAEQFISAVNRFPLGKLVRPVMIHSQFVLPQQLLRLRRAGIIPSFFVDHVYYFGDAHINNLGFERASLLSPANSASKLNLPFTFHQDAPVVEPDMLKTLWCAVNRKTMGGVILGADEAVSVWDALKAVTVNSAKQYGIFEKVGSISSGKKSNFVILDRNPLNAPKEELDKIQVLQTIIGGNVIFG